MLSSLLEKFTISWLSSSDCACPVGPANSIKASHWKLCCNIPCALFFENADVAPVLLFHSYEILMRTLVKTKAVFWIA